MKLLLQGNFSILPLTILEKYLALKGGPTISGGDLPISDNFLHLFIRIVIFLLRDAACGLNLNVLLK